MWIGRRLRATRSWFAARSLIEQLLVIGTVLVSPCFFCIFGVMVRGIYIKKFVYTSEDKQFIKDAQAGRHEYREGLPSVGRRLSAEIEPFHAPDTAVAAHPDWFQYRFPNGEWVFGHGVDSHGFHTGGGTLVVKDSRGLTHVFFGHVCGQNMGFPWGLDSCKGLQDFYKRLSEMSYLEWFP